MSGPLVLAGAVIVALCGFLVFVFLRLRANMRAEEMRYRRRRGAGQRKDEPDAEL